MPGLNGLVVMTPTSIASTGTGNSSSIGANGEVTFSSCVTLSLNGVFTSSYDNYMVVVRHTVSSGVSTYWRFRASGTDNNTSSSYVHQTVEGNGSTISGSRAAENYGLMMTGNATQRNGSSTYVFGPYLTQPTAWRTVSVNDLTSARIMDFAGTHNESTSYDGFTLLPYNGPSITGAITVYGFNQ